MRTALTMLLLLFTISTAEGGFVILLEDLIVHKDYRNHGFGGKLLNYAIEYTKQKEFLRITLLTDRLSEDSQRFYKRHGFAVSSMIPIRLLFTPPNHTPAP